MKSLLSHALFKCCRRQLKPLTVWLAPVSATCSKASREECQILVLKAVGFIKLQYSHMSVRAYSSQSSKDIFGNIYSGSTTSCKFDHHSPLNFNQSFGRLCKTPPLYIRTLQPYSSSIIVKPFSAYGISLPTSRLSPTSWQKCERQRPNYCLNLGRQPLHYCHTVAPIHTKKLVEVEDQPPSWLFVSPAVAGAYGAQVNLDLDHEEKLSGEALQTLEANIRARRLDVDIAGLLNDLNALKKMEEERAALMSKKEMLLQKLRDAKKMEPSEAVEKEKAKFGGQLQAVKTEIAARNSSWDLEEKVMLQALRLPNDLHPDTPVEKTEVLREVNAQPEAKDVLSHVEIGRKFNLIKFSNIGPKAFFLKGDLVLAEMALTSAVCDYLRVKGYRHMNGPEFVKTPIVEGCGGDFRDGNEVFTMVDPHKTVIEPMNHISGVSLHMFAAYVAKTCIGNSVLPLNMFACGRSYKNSNLPGLFGAIQSTQASVFSCVEEDGVDKQFESSLSLIWDFLEQLGFSLRLCQVRAKDLSREEKRRVDVEMYSPHLNQYIQVASVSDVGDYISRRLMVTHNQNHADIRSARRLHMVHGTAVNITSLLAIWMEHSYTNMESFALRSLPGVQKPSSLSL